MKRKPMLLGAVGVFAAAAVAVLAAPIAQGTPILSGPDKRIAKLESQMKSVQADLKSAKATIATLSSTIESINGTVQTAAGAVKCLSYGAVPLNEYGGPSPAPHGYLYSPDGVNVGLTTALDIAPAGSTPGAFVAALDPSCVKAASSAGASSDALHRETRPIALLRFRLPH